MMVQKLKYEKQFSQLLIPSRQKWRYLRRAILFGGPNSVYENEEGTSNISYIKM